ncbi:MAG TPA: hypothetical protein VFL55_26250 [Acetobacteraceae bacterium]|nr:hypothetical protein [Acetobacteraceae bacterium]
MARWREIISIIAVVVTVGGAIAFLVKLNDRVAALETQVHTLTVAPTIAAIGSKAVVDNPVAKACADLAERAMEEGPVWSGNTQQLMRKLGCMQRTAK